MQFTGHAGRHLSQPEQSSGMITTSGPWLKMAPNWGGQWRRQASQLMHSAISMRSGGFFHLGLRCRCPTRSTRAALAAEAIGAASPWIDPRVKGWWTGVTMTDGTPGRRLTDQGKVRKQQLLDQAAILFAERGYADTRIVDICASAGVAKGLFYWYFENKEALFAELVRSMRLKLRTTQSAAIDPDADPLVRIRQGTDASVRFMGQHRAFFALLEVEQRSSGLAAVLREGTEIHVA